MIVTGARTLTELIHVDLLDSEIERVVLTAICKAYRVSI